MYSAGYIKDAIAVCCFIVAFFILIITDNINKLKNIFLYAILFALFADGSFTLFPEYHNTEFGYNTPSYIVITVAAGFLGLIYLVLIKK
jgi:TRAP-type uncharacterized transport system fused permease subunit